MVNSSQVDYWIDSCQDYKHSWLGGFLLTALGGQCQLHWWPNSVTDFKLIKSGDVVVLNDESFMTTSTADLIKIVNLTPEVIIITSNELRYNELLNYNFKKSIFFPYDHWFLNIIGLRKLGTNIKKEPGNRVFNFLNRRWSPGRLHTIEHIFRYHPELLDTGYVTAGTFDYYKDHPKIQTDNEFLNFYHAGQSVIENNNFFIDGMPITSNTKNFIHLAQYIPGLISIQIETFSDCEEFNLLLTEKSMIAIATGQIPIIIGKEPYILKRYLKDQGFDIYDDIVDQSYDFETGYFRRCELAIELNLDYLNGCNQLPNLTERANYNQNHLLTTWCNQILLNLVNRIYQLCLN